LPDWRNNPDAQMPMMQLQAGVAASQDQAMPAVPSAPGGQQNAEPGVNVWNYLWIIRKRFWVVVLMVLLSGVMAAIYLWVRKPVYVASAQVLVQPQNMSQWASTMIQPWQQPSWRQYSQQTHIQILKGRVVMEKVVRKLKLIDRFAGRLGPEQRKMVSEGLEDVIPVGLLENMDDRQGEESVIQDVAEKLSAAIVVTPVKDSFVLIVSCGAGDAQLAADIVNEVVQGYSEYDVELRQQGIQQVLEWLRKQKEVYETKMADTRKKLIQAHAQLDIEAIVTDTGGGGGESGELSPERSVSVLAERMITLNREVVAMEMATKRKRDIMETLQKWVASKESILTLPPSLGGATDQLEQIVAQIQLMEAKRTAEMNQYGPKHPDVVAMSNNIAAMEEEARKELEIAFLKAKADYEMSSRQLRGLSDMLQQEKTRARNLAQARLDVDMISREADSDQKLFETLLSSLKQTDLVGDLQNSNIKILALALVPNRPKQEGIFRVIGFLMFLGMGLGVGLAFLLDAIDNSVRDMDDVERYIGLPVIGFVGNIRESLPTGTPPDQERVPMLADPSSHSMSGEYLRSIRTNVVFSAAGEKKVLLMTSSLPGEGKSTLVSNLAVMLAYAGKKVVLIDADMRRPILHRIFDMDKEPGLSNVLVGAATIDEVLKDSTVPGLEVVGAGPIPPNQAELLQSDAMNELIEILRDRYDFVLFDTPPVCSVTDSVVLSLKVDGTLLVVRAGKTSRYALRTAARCLRTVNAPIMGVLMNGFSLEPSAYYYGKYGGYAYGYGYYYYHYYYRNRDDKKTGGSKGDKSGKPTEPQEPQNTQEKA